MAGKTITFTAKSDQAGSMTIVSGTTAKATVSPASVSSLAANTNQTITVTELMMRQLNPNYAKQQETDEKIKNLESGMSQMSGTLVEMKGMMEKMIAGISSKKSNN